MKNENNNSGLISNLLNSINIVDVIQNYINVNKKGQNYWALCPFHGDKNPSLSISPSKHIFKCFVCNAKGNAINFVMLFKKCTFIEALKEIKTILNIDNQDLEKYINNSMNINKDELEIFDINKKAAFFYHRTLFNKESSHCLNYLKSRSIDEKIIDFYELGFTPKNSNRDYLLKLFEMSDKEKNGEPYLLLKAGLVSINEKENFVDFFFDRLIIPIKNEHGYIVGFSGRSLNKNDKVKYINTKTTDFFKKENILFNFFSFDKSSYEEIYVVEGYMDVFAFKRLGIDNVVAPMGTAFTISQINLIKQYPNIKRIILCFDNDTAGINATISSSEKLVKNNFDIFVVKPFDQKYKDIDELTRNLDKEKCLELINNQIGLIEYKIETLKKLNLSYKEKKIELKKIIEMLNKFAYQEIFFTEDKKLISEFFDIDIKELENLILVRKNKKLFNDSKNNYRDFQFNQFMNLFNKNDFKKENKIYVNKNNYLDSINSKFIKQESTLILNLIFNKQLSKLFLQYLNIYYHNRNNALTKVLKVIVDNIKKALSTEFSTEKIIKNVYESDKLTDNEKKYFLDLVKSVKKFNDFPKVQNGNFSKYKSIDEKIFYQGIYLLKSLKISQFNKAIKEIELQIEKNKLNKNNDLEHLRNLEKEMKLLEKQKEDFIETINNVKLMSNVS